MAIIKVFTMEGRISALTLLCLVLSGVGALQVNIPQDSYEYARGDNITLPCSFTPKTPLKETDLVIIKWSDEAAEVGAEENRILSYYTLNKQLDITPPYEGRVSLDVDVFKGKADLKLSSITLADNKEFQCSVQIPGDDEGKLSDKAQLVVLVAPSIPICKIQGKAEYGQNINLTCLSKEGSPPPTYKWESRDVRNMPRVPDPRTTDKGGILSLFNISRETSGFYICTSSNKIRSATCNLTLSVMPPSMNIGSTAGIIGGVVAALILLIVVIYCCCCRKKNKEEEYAMGVREEEYRDKEPALNGESRHADGQEDTRGRDAASPAGSGDRYEERSERDYDRRSDYNDRRSDYDDRRSDYDDRRSDYTDRRDRNERYDSERHYDDERRYDDRRYDDDRYDEPYDDRGPPRVPANKPTRRDYDD
ncbi:cell surface A33 antigen-like [Acanthopagrus latus]|uniref:cell surface A33 antigen-like n=1 Tax=Acanthopagrus latus TaxID=8177 RepID=UPI00187CEFBE|nr:cell surface A33 antigen-like [Acanthopagrus latus]